MDRSSRLLRPHHPYTRGLLESMPTRSRRGERLSVIKGSVPNPFNMPDGCNFAPRCPSRFAPCGERDPELLRLDDAPDTQVACWLYSEPPAPDAGAPVPAEGAPAPTAGEGGA